MKWMYVSFLIAIACNSSEETLKIYNAEPTAAITSHSDGAELMEGFDINLLGMVADGNHATTDLLVKWSSDTRELCAEGTPDFDGTTVAKHKQ